MRTTTFIQWLNYQGKDILYIDYSSFSEDNTDELQMRLKESCDYILTSGKKNILLVENLDGINMSLDLFSSIKIYIFDIKLYVKKYAVVGVDRIKNVFLATLNTLGFVIIKPFNQIEKAKDWLVKD